MAARHPKIAPGDHTAFMSHAVALAALSPPKPTNFCVGALILEPSSNRILSTGYTLELDGNTHAEQCCFLKLAKMAEMHNKFQYSIMANEEDDRKLEAEGGAGGGALKYQLQKEGVQGQVWLYTTMEPCAKRSIGNKSCTDRILELKDKSGKQWIGKVYVGVREPQIFVQEGELKSGRQRLQDAGIEIIEVPGMEEEILKVAKAGHIKE